MAYKQKVYKVYEYVYTHTPSNIGGPIPRSHPLLQLVKPRYFCITSKRLDVSEGDILRCDGLPFISRPRKIELNCGSRLDIYKPVKLNNGMFVLRFHKSVIKLTKVGK